MASVDNEIALWSGTSGTVLKRSTGTGTVRVTSGVVSLGDSALLPWSSGSYYDPSHSHPMSAWVGTGMTALRLYATPIYVPNDVTASEVGINVTTFVASALGRIGIYSLGSDNKPGALFWQGATTLDFSSNGEKSFTALTLVIPGGRWYYVAAASDSAVSTHQAATLNTTPLGYTSHSSTTRNPSFFKTLGSLVLPDPFGTPTNTFGVYQRVTLRIA